MNDYLIFHRRQFYLERNWLIKANTPQRPVEYGPDLVVDFAQCPRLFFAEPFADILSSMEPFGVERIKNPYKPDEDMYAEIDIGTVDELDFIDEVLYAYFHVFNRYDVLDIDHTIWNSESPAIDAIRTPVLDPAKLAAIPLEQRLLFKLDQDPSFLLVHNSVMDKLIAANLKDVWVRWSE
ncbi:hypothetical protein I6M53_14885 [Shewanella algae]|uniref:hypothetical protein n=1 Tax=Shewanella algae TaxID=38313 RepID=UPI001AAC4CAC|nr:hypothetical protein [Shewanella algae]MBO2675924.1 hypothetical protein [Shewanella algae]